ncbi:MAG: hypothetical protein AB7T07_08875 [Steroidobacteraceae bacterium]
MNNVAALQCRAGAASLCCARLLIGFVSLLLPFVSTQAQESPLETYRHAMQVMLDNNVVPTLTTFLTEKERARLAGFRIEVTNSNDPQQMWPPNLKTGVVSAGFMSLQDILIEAAIIDASDPHPDELFDYAVEVARYGLTVNSFNKGPAPMPFWASIGWQPSRYQKLRSTPAYSTLRYRATQQSLAWLTSVMMYEQVVGPAGKVRNDQLSWTRARKIYENAAALMLRSGLTPAPPWPVAMLYSAAKAKPSTSRSSDAWMCETKQILEISIHTAERPDTTLSIAEQRAQQQMHQDWRNLAIKLSVQGHCESSGRR